ncbi:quinone oxidoreductase [Parasteatoda tepidariorum]|uniref:quinone oxidoreductase n=1 Tax=Parasteatoda tepidariorum TaxID=114398 RepID=UPI00077FA24A|nr:quinone oxidoreductase [Parasteatoda tepidariorum]
MRAIRIERFGPPKVLILKDIEKPEVTPYKILVKIISAGVNPVDTYIREGFYINLPSLPFTPGKDAAGIVESVGEYVTKFKAGDRVFICGRNLEQHGTYAEYTVAPESNVFPLDDKLSFDEGAALGIAYFTAYRALVIKAKCKAGETVLVHGASGSVGLAAVQIAKKLDLKVIGTAGTEDGLKLVKESGADYVLNHKDKDNIERIYEITHNNGVNIIIEMLANVNLDKDLNFLASKGRVAIVGNRGAIKIDPRKLMGPETEIVGVALFSSSEEEWNETSQAVLDGVKEGWVKPVIDRRYSIDNVQRAHEDVMSSSGKRGKLVLTIQDP